LVAAVAQAIVAVVATQFLQGPMFTTFNEMRGHYHSTWYALFIGLCAAFVISMLLMALIAAFMRF
jgi:H+/Cl- antiporter ClcA